MDESFKIKPLFCVKKLLQESFLKQPPKEAGSFRASNLVDLAKLDTSFQMDIRYATANNFVGTAVYNQAKAFLQLPAAIALAEVNKHLAECGFGLIIYDGYRPWYVTWVFWQATPDEQKIFVADPDEGSKHNRGCAIDVGMYSLQSGKPVEFPSGFDEMTPKAFSDYAFGTAQQTYHREILCTSMQKEGFIVHPKEWWHFDYKDWMHYGIQNQKL